jgi:hypothetical protein
MGSGGSKTKPMGSGGSKTHLMGSGVKRKPTPSGVRKGGQPAPSTKAARVMPYSTERGGQGVQISGPKRGTKVYMTKPESGLYRVGRSSAPRGQVVASRSLKGKLRSNYGY